MPNVDELRNTAPREVYALAVRAGLERAIKEDRFRVGNESLKKWREEHPEFSDPRVNELLHQGAADGSAEIVRMCTMDPGIIEVWNSTPDGLMFFDTSGRNEKPVTSEVS